MSNVSKVFATYNGQEFECKVGETYEFSDTVDFKDFSTHILLGLDTTSEYPFSVGCTWYRFIRPVQKKELSAEELYRISGKKGYELKASNGRVGIHVGTLEYQNMPYIAVGSSYLKAHELTHFRKAYSTENWKPISEIEREG